MNEKNTFVAWLGYKGTPDFLKSRTIGGFVGVVILLFTLTVFAFAAIGLVNALRLYVFEAATEANSAAVRNIGLFLVGLLGAPFVAWQAIVRQKQVDIADDVLFNEKLNDANNDLHSRYQTSEKQEDGTYVDIWTDDIIRRNGAIERLRALAEESATKGQIENANTIKRILQVYEEASSSNTSRQQTSSDGEKRSIEKEEIPADLRPDIKSAGQALERLDSPEFSRKILRNAMTLPSKELQNTFKNLERLSKEFQNASKNIDMPSEEILNALKDVK